MAPELALQAFESHGSAQISQLKGYTDQTLVMVELPDTSQRGAFELQRSYVAPHTLTFKPISYAGDGFVKSNVITRILQSEVDYVTKGEEAQTALTLGELQIFLQGRPGAEWAHCTCVPGEAPLQARRAVQGPHLSRYDLR